MTANGEPLRFAIVEDEPFMAELVSDMLASTGMDVEVFPLGTDLLKSEHLLKFRYILLDLSLPDVDGFDLMEMLAADHIEASIVVMSGHHPATLEAAQLYGNGLGLDVQRALTKPFARDELFAALGLPQ